MQVPLPCEHASNAHPSVQSKCLARSGAADWHPPIMTVQCHILSELLESCDCSLWFFLVLFKFVSAIVWDRCWYDIICCSGLWKGRLTGSRNEYINLYLSKWGLWRTCIARVGSVIRTICNKVRIAVSMLHIEPFLVDNCLGSSKLWSAWIPQYLCGFHPTLTKHDCIFAARSHFKMWAPFLLRLTMDSYIEAQDPDPDDGAILIGPLSCQTVRVLGK